ncbi:MAG TPA: hypothetical protein VE782_02665 [Myxococcaceae bacterium]|nr:hypothetical protein [Myxococcaceae bacterium]
MEPLDFESALRIRASSPFDRRSRNFLAARAIPSKALDAPLANQLECEWPTQNKTRSPIAPRVDVADVRLFDIAQIRERAPHCFAERGNKAAWRRR